jgi:hypothetical protein
LSATSKRFAAVLLGAVSALAGLVAGCRANGASTEARISAALASGSTELVLADLAPAAWDRVYVFAPYTPPAEVDRVLGFPWAGAGASGIAERDDIVLLVLVAGAEVAEAVSFPRATADFSGIASDTGYARADARFAVERAGSDPPRIVRRSAAGVD